MKEIALSRGLTATVDSEDFYRLNQRRWFALRSGPRYYAVRWDRVDGRRVCTMMHRVIVQAPQDLQVDHINGNQLDNRRSNLRIVTCSQNLSNQKRHKDSTSPFVGVCRQGRRWRAYFRGKWLGSFACPEDASLAYQEAKTAFFSDL